MRINYYHLPIKEHMQESPATFSRIVGAIPKGKLDGAHVFTWRRVYRNKFGKLMLVIELATIPRYETIKIS